MKLTRILVWAAPNGHQTFLTRSYTNPDIEHIVWLYPNKVVTYTYKDNMNNSFKPGIHLLTRP